MHVLGAHTDLVYENMDAVKGLGRKLLAQCASFYSRFSKYAQFPFHVVSNYIGHVMYIEFQEGFANTGHNIRNYNESMKVLWHLLA